jgi:hypothetical protein
MSEQTTAWQPIETAPRDGTIILLAGGTWGDEDLEEAPRVMAARWYEHQRWRSDPVWGCWNVCCAEGGCSIFPYSDPTHWMPLPEPPHE